MNVHKITGKNMREALERAKEVHGAAAVVLGQSEASEGVALAVTTTAPASRSELERMRRRADELFKDVARDDSSTVSGPSEVEERLISYGCTPGFAAAAWQEAVSLTERHPLDAAAEVLGSRPQIAKLPKLPGKTRVLAMLGHSGAGKTLSLAKLSTRLVRAERRVHLAGLADGRVGATAPLEAHGALLDTEVRLFGLGSELNASTLGAPGPEAVLLDTTGNIEQDVERLAELERTLDSSGAVLDVQLVLGANEQADSWAALFEAASVLPVGGCIVTKLDETRRPAAVLEAICEESLPVAFLSAGSDLARDLVRATPDTFADLFLRGRVS
jgi:flagellar biosynthesis GTPase FlhF